jgi:adenine-specific DNA-methyltransferase
MPKKKTLSKNKNIDKYIFDEKRKNIPEVGLVSNRTDKIKSDPTKYQHDPYVDPSLSWSGKAENDELEIQETSLHIHEKIDTQRIIKSFLKKNNKNSYTPSLFEELDIQFPINKIIDFYSHDYNWSNRLIAGDSLIAMNSLIVKEGMQNSVQTIFFDPPYGIKYNSNFQPFTKSKTTLGDDDVNLSSEPEMIKAFRDTWHLEIHSYLSFLRNIVFLGHKLLKESGSIFIQISEDNVHYVRQILDEVFGKENFVSQINIKRANMTISKALLNTATYYVVWYAKQKKDKNGKQILKYNQLYKEKDIQTFVDTAGSHAWFENKKTKKTFKATPEQRRNVDNFLKENPELICFRTLSMTSMGETPKKQIIEFNGEKFEAHSGSHFSVTDEGIKNLISKNRLIKEGNNIFYKYYYDDYPITELNSLWEQIGPASSKIYVVQTPDEVVKRCILMSSNPGDLVLDPTCGSGTSAYVSEQFGRRWITIDSSRIALTLAKQRLLTSIYPFYKIINDKKSVSNGFQYKEAKHITRGSIANNEREEIVYLVDQPLIDNSKLRVSGPFTVEAVPSNEIKVASLEEGKSNYDISRSSDLTVNELEEWIDELKSTGIRGLNNKIVEFSNVKLRKGSGYIHGEGEVINDKQNTHLSSLISFGPKFNALDQRQIESVVEEILTYDKKPDLLIFAFFHIDPEASKDIDHMNISGCKIIKAQMNLDLITKDLKRKKSSNQSYWLIGSPDIEIIKTSQENFKIKILGFDYYDPIQGKITSGSTKDITMWMLDTDYDEKSLFPDQVFLVDNDSNRNWDKIKKLLKDEINEDELKKFYSDTSLEFKLGKNKKIGVKIIDSRGIESLIIKKMNE